MSNSTVVEVLSELFENIPLTTLINIAIFIIIVVLVRYLVAWFVTTLVRRGLISTGTRMILTRIIDILVVIIIAVVVVHTITASLTPYIIVTVIGLLVIVMFYYEIKEFTAFITIQLQRYAKGIWIEVYLPNYSSPIRGRLTEIQPFNSVIEDVYGNKIYIANSVLVNSLIKEFNPSIFLELTVTSHEYLNITEILQTIKEVVSGSPFRLDESYMPIKSMSTASVSLVLRLIPLSTPVRASDLYRLMRQISTSLSQYNPIVEVLNI